MLRVKNFVCTPSDLPRMTTTKLQGVTGMADPFPPSTEPQDKLRQQTKAKGEPQGSPTVGARVGSGVC